MKYENLQNNKHAEKWTEEETVKLMEKALESINEECYFLAEVAVACGVYRELFWYLCQKFKDNPTVFNLIKGMYTKCEAIIIRQAASKKIDTTVGIFALKVYHGFVEASKLNIGDADGEKIQSPEWLNTLSFEQLKELAGRKE